jgi:hypothetical protein
MKKRATKKPPDRPKKAKHPYEEFESHPYWKRIDKGIAGLVKNGDLVEKTVRPNIVGYLCKTIVTRQKRAKRRKDYG